MLDHDNFAGVPETRVVTIRGMIGSLQRFVPGCIESWNTTPGAFSVAHVHRIAILDIRLLNCDRHGGNVLVRADRRSLVPIDHSYVLPHGWSDPEFEWMEWPQAKQPLCDEELRYVARVDARRDRNIVAAVLGEESAEVVFVATVLLQHAAAKGYTLKDVAAFCRRATLTQPSGLEQLMGVCVNVDTWQLDEEAVMEQIKAAFP